MKLDKTITFLSTFNFVLCFVGYQLATTLFLPSGNSDLEGISRTVTVPYRTFALLISLIVIILNFNKPINKLSVPVKLFLIYLFFFICRMASDIFFRADVNITDTSQLWLYVFGIIIPSMISVILSYRKIDLQKAVIWIYASMAVVLLFTLFTNQMLLAEDNDSTIRVDANLALNTISYGHFGVSAFFLSIFLLMHKPTNVFYKTIIITFAIVAFYSTLRAGSRGPIVAFLIVGFFWIFARGKNLIFSLFVIVFLFIIMVANLDIILSFLGDISNVIEERLRETIYEGDTSNRNPLYQQAFNIFLDNPLIGKQFALFVNGEYAYPHNIILESMMALGIGGGLVLVYVLISAIRKSYMLINSRNANYWVCLILIQQIISNMTSGAIYNDPLLSILLIFIFLYYDNINQTILNGQ